MVAAVAVVAARFGVAVDWSRRELLLFACIVAAMVAWVWISSTTPQLKGFSQRRRPDIAPFPVLSEGEAILKCGALTN